MTRAIEPCLHYWIDAGDRRYAPVMVDGLQVMVRHARFRCRNCGRARWFRDEIPALALDYFRQRILKLLKPEEPA